MKCDIEFLKLLLYNKLVIRYVYDKTKTNGWIIMAIKSDWHIHTHCSCDSACMEFETLINDAKALGITDFGVSDHYHTRLQESDIAASRADYEATIVRHPELKGHFHFGIEATVVSEWEVEKIKRKDYDEFPEYGIRVGGPAGAPVMFDIDDEFVEKYKIDYVVAGMHWPMYCGTDTDSLLKEYHRQYMFCATNPLSTILAHYLWWDDCLYSSLWNMPDLKNPFLNFSVIPESMRDELKSALTENNVAFELNPCMFNKNMPTSFVDDYLGWASDLAKSGVTLAFGSDCHRPRLADVKYREIEGIFTHYGIDTDKFFSL